MTNQKMLAWSHYQRENAFVGGVACAVAFFGDAAAGSCSETEPVTVCNVKVQDVPRFARTGKGRVGINPEQINDSVGSGWFYFLRCFLPFTISPAAQYWNLRVCR